MNTIKTWEERKAEYLKKYPKATVSIEMFMKDELDDYRQAARATPAQPVGYVLFTGHGDKFSREKPKCEIDYWKPVYLESSRPSPSSVGAAIPEGWKLVPVEVTQEMLDAVGMCPVVKGKEWMDKVHREDWAKFLSAAPSIAQDGQKSEADHG
jgi:hypothetical protein